jgi:hypothetical protein
MHTAKAKVSYLKDELINIPNAKTITGAKIAGNPWAGPEANIPAETLPINPNNKYLLRAVRLAEPPEFSIQKNGIASKNTMMKPLYRPSIRKISSPTQNNENIKTRPIDNFS